VDGAALTVAGIVGALDDGGDRGEPSEAGVTFYRFPRRHAAGGMNSPDQIPAPASLAFSWAAT